MSKFEDELPDWCTGFDGSECDSEDGVDTGEEKHQTDRRRLVKVLDQLDAFHQQKRLDVLQAREELKAFHLHVTELQKMREQIEVDIEREEQAEDSAALLALRAKHKRVCVELQAEEDLGAHLEMVLKEHELDLHQVEVELGRHLDLRQELELEEKKVQTQDEKKQKLRLQRQKRLVKAQRRKAQRDKIERDKLLQEQADVQRKQQEQALASRLKTAVYLKQTLQRMRQKEAETEQRRMEMLKKRQAAVMDLNASYIACQENMNARKVRQKAYEQKRRQQEQQMQESLEAQGLNSVKLMHHLNLQERLSKKNTEFEETQTVRRMEIVSKLLSERNTKERHSKSPVLKRERKHDEKLLQNILPPSGHTRREESHVMSRARASSVSFRSVSISDVTSSSDSSELRWEEPIEAEHEGEGQQSLAQPEFPGLWDYKHQEYMATSDEIIHLKASHSTKETDENKGLKAAKKTEKSKEPKGPPFMSKPKIILFKDFVVGRIYKKKVTLTNVTYATNYCKLLGVSENLKDHVSVSFEPTVPMSTGMACKLEAIFRPLLDLDLEGVIHFQSATDPFSVPIKCSKRKCEVDVDQCVVDFGTHVVGQTVSREITVTNRGALGTRYTLTPVSSGPPDHTQVSFKTGSLMNSSDAENTDKITASTEHVTQSDLRPGVSPDELSLAGPGSVEHSTFELNEFSFGEACEGDVGPFLNVKLPIIFTPTIPGEAKLDFQISFSQPGCDPIVVSVHGLAESPPVWVTKPNIDLKICMYDLQYQDIIEVQSRASSALRLTFGVCKELRNHVTIHPRKAVIQAKSTFRAQLKFLPRQSLYADAKRFFNRDTGVLEVPLTVQVANQVRPVEVMLHAVVTCSDLTFDLSEVDFGHCTVYECVRATVRLTNTSLLPQEFGFVGIPKFIEVQPNDGFGTLLPSQTLDIQLIFSAPKAGEYNFTLTCKTLINREFVLSCRATGVQPSLKLSEFVLEFGGTALGDRSTAVLFVESQSSRPQLFAFAVPEHADFSISPSSGRVLPGQRRLVQVTFSPALSDDVIKAETLRRRDANDCQHSETDSKDRAEALVKDGGSSAQIPPRSFSPAHDVQTHSSEYLAAKASLLRSFTERHVRHVVPCFIASERGHETPEEPRHSPQETLFLELRCLCVRPALLIVGGQDTLRFGQVITGLKVVKKVIIQNISSETVKLTSSVLDPSGPFSVLNATRAVAPEDTHTLLIACTPQRANTYCETLEVSCGHMTLEMTLMAEAVDPPSSDPASQNIHDGTSQVFSEIL